MKDLTFRVKPLKEGSKLVLAYKHPARLRYFSSLVLEGNEICGWISDGSMHQEVIEEFFQRFTSGGPLYAQVLEHDWNRFWKKIKNRMVTIKIERVDNGTDT
jgi:hypothetical protein